MTLSKRFDLTSLPKQTVEMIEKHPQQFEQIMGEMNSKSKKKRLQKKILKFAVQRLSRLTMVSENTETIKPVAEVVKTTPPRAVDVTETFNFSKLPVGFVLKTGKQFFGNEDIFRFYYNQNHPNIYKNKELLINTFKTLVNDADNNVLSEIRPLLQDQLSS